MSPDVSAEHRCVDGIAVTIHHPAPEVEVPEPQQRAAPEVEVPEPFETVAARPPQEPRRRGPRNPVLLLHGIGGCADTFGGLAPHLAAAGWRAVAWDAPGYGDSADPGPEAIGPDSPGAYVDRVAALVAGLGADRVHLVGVSWGGVIATHVASRRPDLVASLTLVDSTRGSGIAPQRAEAMRSRVKELDAVGAQAFATARAPRLLAGDPDPGALESVRGQMAGVRLPGYAGAAEMMAQSDTGDLLAELTCRALVVVGAEDRVTGVDESRLLADRIPGAHLAVVDRAGHAAVQEQPAAVAQVLLEFLTAGETSGFETVAARPPRPPAATPPSAPRRLTRPSATGGSEAAEAAARPGGAR